MCAIVDANVVGELWENSNSDAGKGFRRWVEESNGLLIVGGKLLQELNSKRATRWINRLALAGKLITIDDRKGQSAKPKPPKPCLFRLPVLQI